MRRSAAGLRFRRALLDEVVYRLRADGAPKVLMVAAELGAEHGVEVRPAGLDAVEELSRRYVSERPSRAR